MCLVHVFIFVKRAKHMYEIKKKLNICLRWEHREERRDEMRVQRGEETKLKKMLISGSEYNPKKLIIEFNFITKLPSETSVYLKSPPATFQSMLFKHGFFSNNFQIILFWTPWPNIFFQILDTSVQCLNTKHCVLSWQTKRPLNSHKHALIIRATTNYIYNLISSIKCLLFCFALFLLFHYMSRICKEELPLVHVSIWYIYIENYCFSFFDLYSVYTIFTLSY